MSRIYFPMMKSRNILAICLVLVMSVFLIGRVKFCQAQGRTVLFDSNPQGAEVYFKNELKGTTPLQMDLPDSELKTVSLLFKKDGYEDKDCLLSALRIKDKDWYVSLAEPDSGYGEFGHIDHFCDSDKCILTITLNQKK